MFIVSRFEGRQDWVRNVRVPTLRGFVDQIFQFLFASVSADADTAFCGNSWWIYYFYSRYIQSQWHLSVCPLVRTIEMNCWTMKSWNSVPVVFDSVNIKDQKGWNSTIGSTVELKNWCLQKKNRFILEWQQILNSFVSHIYICFFFFTFG